MFRQQRVVLLLAAIALCRVLPQSEATTTTSPSENEHQANSHLDSHNSYHHLHIHSPQQNQHRSGAPTKDGSWGPRPLPSTTPSSLSSRIHSEEDGNGCRIGEKLYQVGDKWTPEEGCGRHTCEQGGKISFMGCPSLATTDPSCVLTEEDSRQPWPLCCPRLQCS